MAIKEEDFNTALHINKTLTCVECSVTWDSSKVPQEIKVGLLAIEDDCPSCGKHILKCV